MHPTGLENETEPAVTTSDADGPMVPALVSIVIPCYQGAQFLAEAIESCLEQTYSDIEVIVVDDASPDDCAEIAEGYARRDGRVRVVRRAVNGGVSRAFNSGFEVARGEYFTRLAQDDRFREDAIDIMVRRIQEHPDAGLVYCDMQTMDEDGAVTGRSTAAEPDEFREDRHCLGVCVMWPRAVWREVGGFDPEFDTAEDYEYWRRIIKGRPLYKCDDEAPLFFRVHEQQGSNQFAVRQEFAHWNARIRHCGSRWEAKRLKGRCFAEVAYIHRTNRRILPALSCLVASVFHWPFSPRTYKGLVGTLCDPMARGASRLLSELRRATRTN